MPESVLWLWDRPGLPCPEDCTKSSLLFGISYTSRLASKQVLIGYETPMLLRPGWNGRFSAPFCRLTRRILPSGGCLCPRQTRERSDFAEMRGRRIRNPLIVVPLDIHPGPRGKAQIIQLGTRPSFLWPTDISPTVCQVWVLSSFGDVTRLVPDRTFSRIGSFDLYQWDVGGFS